MATGFPFLRRRRAEELTPAPAASGPPADRFFLSLSLLIYILLDHLLPVYYIFIDSFFVLFFVPILVVVLWAITARRSRRMTMASAPSRMVSDPLSEPTLLPLTVTLLSPLPPEVTTEDSSFSAVLSPSVVVSDPLLPSLPFPEFLSVTVLDESVPPPPLMFLDELLDCTEFFPSFVEVDFVEPQEAEVEEEEEEKLFCFTVIHTQYGVAVGYNDAYIGRLNPQKMKAVLRGLDLDQTAVRFVDSWLIAYIVSVPDRGLVLVHRGLVSIGAIQADLDVHYIFAMLYDIGPQMRSSDCQISLPSACSTASSHQTDISPSVEVHDTVLSINAWIDSSDSESCIDSSSESITAEPKEEKEEKLFSFTVVYTQHSLAVGHNDPYMGRPTPQKMKTTLMGLDQSAIRFVDSRLFVYIVSEPDRGLVFVHRHLVSIGTVAADTYCQYILAMLYDIGPQLMVRSNESQLYLSSASSTAGSHHTDTSPSIEDIGPQLKVRSSERQFYLSSASSTSPSHHRDISASVEVHDTSLSIDACTNSLDSSITDLGSELSTESITDSCSESSSESIIDSYSESGSGSSSESSSTESCSESITDSCLATKPRRSSRLAQKEKKEYQDNKESKGSRSLVSSNPPLEQACKKKSKKHEERESEPQNEIGSDQARPRRSSRLADKARRARALK